MKKYLLTWYGITDLRASLGLEKTSGPVLGALLAERYTDVHILGFTHPDKKVPRVDEFHERLANLKDSDLIEARRFIDQFSNSHEAHNHFNQWLENQLRDAGKKVEVRFESVDLKHLNDTEGIYDAANQALNVVAASEGEKLVTLFLSPGTPVMAFVWAFAALRHPTLKKRLIASSQPGKPPERIILPNEWLEWHGRQVRATNTDSNQYDVIFHLFGEQRMPSLLGMIQFSCGKHIFVNSEKYPADVMKQFLDGADYGEIAIDPFDPESVRSTILDEIAKMSPSLNIGFNLTGGTKLMYAGALAACRKVNATPFYFNSQSNQLVDLNNFESTETKQIQSVETFLKLNGNKLFISREGYWEDIPDIDNPNRLELTKKLWFQRSAIAGLYYKLAHYNDLPGENFKFSTDHISVSLEEGRKATIIIKDHNGKEKAFRFQNWPDLARYLSGGWFEEYTYMKLKPHLESGLIKDLRIGLEVGFKEDFSDNRSFDYKEQLLSQFGETYQELDVAFTDGKRLFIIECKAGSVKGDQLSKFESVIRYYGGIEGRGVLACCFPIKSSAVKQKAREAHNIQLITGKYLFNELDEYIYDFTMR